MLGIGAFAGQHLAQGLGGGGGGALERHAVPLQRQVPPDLVLLPHLRRPSGSPASSDEMQACLWAGGIGAGLKLGLW